MVVLWHSGGLRQENREFRASLGYKTVSNRKSQNKRVTSVLRVPKQWLKPLLAQPHLRAARHATLGHPESRGGRRSVGVPSCLP